MEAAVAKFETRAAKTEERTAKAFESVASWIEQSQEDRAKERATLHSVAEKLTAIEQRSVQRPNDRRCRHSAALHEATTPGPNDRLRRRPVALHEATTPGPNDRRLLSRGAPRADDAGADIDKRLSALARRVAAPERPRIEPRRRDERSRIDVRDFVVQIARRQAELDFAGDLGAAILDSEERPARFRRRSRPARR